MCLKSIPLSLLGCKNIYRSLVVRIASLFQMIMDCIVHSYSLFLRFVDLLMDGYLAFSVHCLS
jgi:hypothetical protein